MRLKNAILCLVGMAILTFSYESDAKTKVGEVRLQTHSANEEKIVIDVQGTSTESPELKIEKNVMQVTFPDSYVWPKVEKQAKTPIGQENVQLLAYQYDPATVRVRLVFNYNIENRKMNSFLNLKDGQVELVFPKGGASIGAQNGPVKTSIPVKAEVAKNENAKIKGDKNKYDEEYLNQLLGDKDAKVEAVEKTNETLNKLEAQLEQSPVKQEEKTVTKTKILEKSDNSNLAATAGKMLGVLLLVLGIFFALVQVAKKGMFKKSGLSFLNDAKLVTVLNTTYIAPKRSLITVKVHNQVILLAQSEAGIQYLTEVKGVADFLKDGERQVVGSNFDDKVEEAEELAPRNSKIKLKENIEESRGTLAERITDKVSFTSQVKNKLKELKPLQ